VITDGSPQSREYRLATMNYIGRSDESQIVIAKPGVSRKHALIIASADGFTIRDLGSQNGTFVNGKRIADHQLKNGDQIAIADTKLTFRSPWPHGAKG
jgi:pSer/pThr/pTyr-binding forkhead associated (FHA) protein